MIIFQKPKDVSYACITNYGYAFIIKQLYNKEKLKLYYCSVTLIPSISLQEKVMAFSSNNHVSTITNQLQNANIWDVCARHMRRIVGSVRALSEATEERGHTLIGKLFSKNQMETDVVRK